MTQDTGSVDIPTKCECHMMEAVAESKYPITFDREQGVYLLCNSLSLAHCMFCGGSLPFQLATESAKPNPTEEREALTIVDSVGSLDELVSVLGNPNEMVIAEDAEDTYGFTAALDRMQNRHPATYEYDPNDQWKRMARYTDRWVTLALDVYEFPDGRLEPSVFGLSPDESVIVEKSDRSWWSLLLWRRKAVDTKSRM